MIIFADVLRVYILLLLMRIFLTWVSTDQSHPFFRVLGAITDPWLNLFRGVRLRFGGMDFSPMIAIGVIVVVQGLAEQLGREGALSVGIILAAILTQMWVIVSSIVFLIGLLALVRALAIQFRWGGEAIWHFVDAMLQPLAYTINRVLKRDAFFRYSFTLAIVVVFAVLINLGGGLGVSILAKVLESLPF